MDEDLAAHRAQVRAGRFDGPTAGLLGDRAQANVVILPAEWAEEFGAFAAANPRPCPVIDRSAPGAVGFGSAGPDADIRTDVPRYRVFVDGEQVAEPTDVRAWWRDDLVAFLLGCSFTFERAMADAGLPLRHVEQGVNVPMYITDRPCESTGRLAGPMVVSMRPVPRDAVDRAAQATARYGLAHGAPVHAGDPSVIGIADLDRPDFGDPVAREHGDVPVFWACGVTPQVVVAAAGPPLLLTHAPGHMFITDLPHDALLGDPDDVSERATSP
ncbi:MAG: putative hydro-lyase [Actinobacteria bacterium]|nr:putative hydro-lyase [Actinomycetota bacterium]